MKGPINEPKLFTVEEANQLLPMLTSLLQELSVRKRQIEDKQVEIDALELIADENTPKVRSELLTRSGEFNEMVNQFNERIKKVEDTGAVLKDIDSGLVDFFAAQDGRVVFLCWKLGEPGIENWHEVDSGFANRKPIE